MLTIAATAEALYPLTGLLSLTGFNRLIWLRPSGLVRDSDQLDLLFTLPMETPVLGISATNHGGDTEASIVLFEPSKTAYQHVIDSLNEASYSETGFLHDIPMMTDLAEDKVHLVGKTSALQSESDHFDATEFMDITGFIHIFDPNHPGPEYDIPKEKLPSIQPRGVEPRKAWERSYELYRQQRIDLCGLDLEPFEPPLAS